MDPILCSPGTLNETVDVPWLMLFQTAVHGTRDDMNEACEVDVGPASEQTHDGSIREALA